MLETVRVAREGGRLNREKGFERAEVQFRSINSEVFSHE